MNTVMPDGRGWKLAAGSPSFLKSLKAKTIPQPPDWLIEKLNGQPKGRHLPDTQTSRMHDGRGDHGGRGQHMRKPPWITSQPNSPAWPRETAITPSTPRP